MNDVQVSAAIGAWLVRTEYGVMNDWEYAETIVSICDKVLRQQAASPEATERVKARRERALNWLSVNW